MQRLIASASGDVAFTVIAPTGSSAWESPECRNATIHYLPLRELSRRAGDVLWYLPTLLANAVRVKNIARRESVEVLHVNDFYNLVGVVSRLFGFRGKLVVHVRFMPDRFPLLGRIWTRLQLAAGADIVCVSEAVRHQVRADARIHVIYDPLPPDRPELHRLGESNQVRLVYVGNYARGKGQDYAIRAFAMALKSDPRLRLTFVGDDARMVKNQRYREELRSYCEEQRLSDVVKFETASEDVARKLMESDIALNFSESESLSMTCLEALFYGTPLIATDSGGPRELFEPGRSGILVTNRDVAAMASAILLLAGSPKLRTQLARAGAEYVRAKFSHENTTARLIDLYAGTAGTRTSA